MEFRILNSCCEFLACLGGTINIERGYNVNMRCLYERYQPQHKVLDSSEVVGYKPRMSLTLKLFLLSDACASP